MRGAIVLAVVLLYQDWQVKISLLRREVLAQLITLHDRAYKSHLYHGLLRLELNAHLAIALREIGDALRDLS